MDSRRANETSSSGQANHDLYSLRGVAMNPDIVRPLKAAERGGWHRARTNDTFIEDFVKVST